MSDAPPYRIETRADKWRFVCPVHEHTDWYAWDGVFSCRTCKANRDVGEDTETVYPYLIDRKTGEEVTREDLIIKQRSTNQAATGD